MQGPLHGGRFHGQGRLCLPPHNEGRIFVRWVSQGGSWILMVSRVGYLGVWVLSCPMYFNFCPFFLKTLNYRSPYGDELIFMSRNGNSLFVATWNISSFAGSGRLTSVVRISAVKWRCWFPADMFTVFWNSSNQCLIYFTLFFTLNTTRLSYW